MGAGNGNRSSNFVGGNGISRVVGGNGRFSGGLVGCSQGGGCPPSSVNYDVNGSYLVFNVADMIFISDLESSDKVFCIVRLSLFLLFALDTGSLIYVFNFFSFEAGTD